MPADGSPGSGGIGRIDEHVRAVGGRLAASSPRLGRALQPLREAYVRAFVGAIALRNRWRYRAPPVPDRLLPVDPARIERVREFAVSKFRLSGVVRCGDWDLGAGRFEDLPVYQGFVARFEDGIDWAETDFFDDVLETIEAGGTPWGCQSRAELEARCRGLDELYESVRDSGFRSQAELHADRGEAPLFDSGKPAGKRRRDEVAVHIGRDGDFLFEDGRNRLAIAKLLDVEAVPVRVLLRHCEWQATREAHVRGELPASDPVTDHPDLRALPAHR